MSEWRDRELNSFFEERTNGYGKIFIADQEESSGYLLPFICW
jgi:hypothetical protein